MSLALMLGSATEMSRKEERLDKGLKVLLWGYPQLLNEFENRVKHKLVSSQEQRVQARCEHRTGQSAYGGPGSPLPDYLRVDRIQTARVMDMGMQAHPLEVHYRRRPGVSHETLVRRIKNL